MKLSKKLRIVAAATAAITTICTAQAFGASADWVPFEYTSTPQYVCEQDNHMTSIINAWKAQGGSYPANSHWYNPDRIQSGVVLGAGFSRTNPSNEFEGMMLWGDRALVRSMATDYFGTTYYQELTPNARYFMFRLGDQLKIKRGSTTKNIFLYQTGATMKAVELNSNGNIVYNTSFTSGGGATIFRNGQEWQVLTVTRPFKQGDVNGDGYAFADRYADFYGDVDILDGYVKYGTYPTGDYDWAVMMGCSSMYNRTWLSSTDVSALRTNLNSSNSNYNSGRMNGNKYYLMKVHC